MFASSEDYKKHLYSDERLAVEPSLFFEFSLPLLAHAATGHPVIHTVSHSSSLPEKYVERLKAAAERHSFLRLDARDDGQGAPAWCGSGMRREPRLVPEPIAESPAAACLASACLPA